MSSYLLHVQEHVYFILSIFLPAPHFKALQIRRFNFLSVRLKWCSEFSLYPWKYSKAKLFGYSLILFMVAQEGLPTDLLPRKTQRSTCLDILERSIRLTWYIQFNMYPWKYSGAKFFGYCFIRVMVRDKDLPTVLTLRGTQRNTCLGVLEWSIWLTFRAEFCLHPWRLYCILLY